MVIVSPSPSVSNRTIWAVLAIKPFPYFTKVVGKIGARNAHVDDPHSGSPQKVL
jgi:hypothetical protein